MRRRQPRSRSQARDQPSASPTPARRTTSSVVRPLTISLLHEAATTVPDKMREVAKSEHSMLGIVP